MYLSKQRGLKENSKAWSIRGKIRTGESKKGDDGGGGRKEARKQKRKGGSIQRDLLSMGQIGGGMRWRNELEGEREGHYFAGKSQHQRVRAWEKKKKTERGESM